MSGRFALTTGKGISRCTDRKIAASRSTGLRICGTQNKTCGEEITISPPRLGSERLVMGVAEREHDSS